jgi:hypothetical protein
LHERFKPCVDYAFSLLLGSDNWSDESVKWSLGYSSDNRDVSKGSHVNIVPSGFFERKIYGTAESLPRLPLEQIRGVPLLFGKPAIQRKGTCLIVHADIIASAYFMLTRYEEMVRRDVRDEHGRFPGKESLAYRAGFIARPIVDEYAELLRKWLRAVGVVVPPPNRQFSILPTHDVDSLRRYRKWHQPYRTVAAALLGRYPKSVLGQALGCSWGLRRDPWEWDVFEEMTELDQTTRERPVYFFLAGGPGGHNDAYSIRSGVARRVIEKVRQAGAAIGLHASYEAGIHPELIAEERVRLEEVCGFPIRRNRHHFLAWREVEDGRELAKAGIAWDATLGYADVAGFRLGVCHPIPLFDPVTIQPMGIEEHPLIVMDRTLSHSSYMNLSEEHALSYCKKLMDETRKHNGEFVILWHSNALNGDRKNYHGRLYRKLLAHAAGRSERTDGRP